MPMVGSKKYPYTAAGKAAARADAAMSGKPMKKKKTVKKVAKKKSMRRGLFGAK
jgi:hypothetical protein